MTTSPNMVRQMLAILTITHASIRKHSHFIWRFPVGQIKYGFSTQRYICPAEIQCLNRRKIISEGVIQLQLNVIQIYMPSFVCSFFSVIDFREPQMFSFYCSQVSLMEKRNAQPQEAGIDLHDSLQVLRLSCLLSFSSGIHNLTLFASQINQELNLLPHFVFHPQKPLLPSYLYLLRRRMR